jgi:hypothetical protein
VVSKPRAGVLGVLAAALVLAGCGGGSASPAVPAAPATIRQLDARLAKTADLPDGIKASIPPASGVKPAPEPPFSKAPCSQLVDWLMYLSYGPAPVLEGDSVLVKLLVPKVTDIITQAWQGEEIIEVFRGDGAQQAMTALARDGSRCTAAVPFASSAGLRARTRVRPLAGLGDQALYVQASVMGSTPVVIANDWILIRSGRCLLIVEEQGTALPHAADYLMAAAHAAWRAYQH